MTPDQIKMIRDYSWKDDGTGQHMAGRLAIVFNNEVCFVDTRDYIIWDDANELVHCIRANSEDPVSQATCPYRITTGMYENAQYLEGLYNMRNLKTAIKEMFLDKGLITEAQQEEILNWADSIRNQPLDYKAKGPYFKETTLPPASDYKPEIREDDGIHRAAPTNFYTYKERIDNMLKPVIATSTLKPVERAKDYYDIFADSIDSKSIATQMKNVIETFPVNNIQKATFSTNLSYVEYDSKHSNLFIDSVDKLIKNTMDSYNWKTHITWTITLDAFNTRKQYFFSMKVGSNKPGSGETPENPLKPSRK